MSINLTVPEKMETPELKPRISVIGVGGAGGNAVNNMIAAGLEGCDFIVANTDSQALTQSKADRRIQLGEGLTRGLGAGSKPEVGRGAAEEAIEHILSALDGSNMVFIAAGMGGGTGTGAAPVIARAAKDAGILTVGVVTKPFQFEGAHRMRLAEDGLHDLEQFVDTLIIIPNQNLFRVANEKTTFADAFRMADDVLYSGVRSVTDLMVMPGLINLDFADVQSVMQGMGRAMMGTGEAEGERRALDAAETAISNPLLDDASMRGARGVLINITGGPDITLFEVDEAANRVRSEVDEDAYIIIGSAFDPDLEGKMRVSVVATGIAAEAGAQPAPHTHLLGQGLGVSTIVPAEDAPEGDADAGDGDDEAPMTSFDDAMGDEDDSEAVSADETVDGFEAAYTEDAELAEDARMASEAADSEPSVETPAHMPGQGVLDAFIPRQAAMPEPPAQARAEAQNPMGVADLVNGSGQQADTPAPASAAGGGSRLFKRSGKERGPSLFERVTGTGRAAEPVEGAANEAPAGAKAAPRPKERHGIRAIVTQEVVHPKPAGQKSSLDGVSPEDRLPTAEPEEDLLDIPAFLRRQAN